MLRTVRDGLRLQRRGLLRALVAGLEPPQVPDFRMGSVSGLVASWTIVVTRVKRQTRNDAKRFGAKRAKRAKPAKLYGEMEQETMQAFVQLPLTELWRERGYLGFHPSRPAVLEAYDSFLQDSLEL